MPMPTPKWSKYPYPSTQVPHLSQTGTSLQGVPPVGGRPVNPSIDKHARYWTPAVHSKPIRLMPQFIHPSIHPQSAVRSHHTIRQHHQHRKHSNREPRESSTRTKHPDLAPFSSLLVRGPRPQSSKFPGWLASPPPRRPNSVPLSLLYSTLLYSHHCCCPIPFFYSTVPRHPFFHPWPFFLSFLVVSPLLSLLDLQFQRELRPPTRLEQTQSNQPAALLQAIESRRHHLDNHPAYGYASKPFYLPSWHDTAVYRVCSFISRRDALKQISARRRYVAPTICCTTLHRHEYRTWYSVHRVACPVQSRTRPRCSSTPPHQQEGPNLAPERTLHSVCFAARLLFSH